MERVVLIVEDDLKNLKLFRVLLQRDGYSTIEAVDGQQAVELTRERHPDLILMDVQMPVMSGIEATERLKADPATRGVPIVAVTAFAMEGDKEKLLQAGFDGYISKPIDIKRFGEEVRRFLK